MRSERASKSFNSHWLLGARAPSAPCATLSDSIAWAVQVKWAESTLCTIGKLMKNASIICWDSFSRRFSFPLRTASQPHGSRAACEVFNRHATVYAVTSSVCGAAPKPFSCRFPPPLTQLRSCCCCCFCKWPTIARGMHTASLEHHLPLAIQRLLLRAIHSFSAPTSCPAARLPVGLSWLGVWLCHCHCHCSSCKDCPDCI